MNLKSGKGSVAKGEGAADLTVTVSDDTFFDISQGKMNAQQVRLNPRVWYYTQSDIGKFTHVGVTVLDGVDAADFSHVGPSGFHEGRHQDQG